MSHRDKLTNICKLELFNSIAFSKPGGSLAAAHNASINSTSEKFVDLVNSSVINKRNWGLSVYRSPTIAGNRSSTRCTKYLPVCTIRCHSAELRDRLSRSNRSMIRRIWIWATVWVRRTFFDSSFIIIDLVFGRHFIQKRHLDGIRQCLWCANNFLDYCCSRITVILGVALIPGYVFGSNKDLVTLYMYFA